MSKKNKKVKLSKTKMPKDKLPKEAILTIKDNLYWNYIPLGITRNEKNKKVTIGWTLNNQDEIDFKLSKYNIMNLPCTAMLVTGDENSGKTAVERNIISHIKEHKDHFQAIGFDINGFAFSDIKSDFNALLTDVTSSANAILVIQQIMMSRFKLMEKNVVNNVYKLSNTPVPYYEVNGINYQFDTIFQIETTLDKESRDYNKLKAIYPDGKQPIIMTIEDIYNNLKDETFKSIVINNKTITKKDIKEINGIFNPNVIMCIVDCLENIMRSDDYRAIDTFKQAIGSIARLGRGAGIHLVLCCNRASGNVVSSDLFNNIGVKCLLGSFDDGASNLVFEKDISDMCKPHIKGRGFIGIGNYIYETQFFSSKLTYF